jgi:hypothetical protein
MLVPVWISLMWPAHALLAFIATALCGVRVSVCVLIMLVLQAM